MTEPESLFRVVLRLSLLTNVCGVSSIVPTSLAAHRKLSAHSRHTAHINPHQPLRSSYTCTYYGACSCAGYIQHALGWYLRLLLLPGARPTYPIYPPTIPLPAPAKAENARWFIMERRTKHVPTDTAPEEKVCFLKIILYIRNANGNCYLHA